MKIGEPFNPHGLFVGSFIPNCIMQCSELSPIAKLAWARLQQFAGENGSCYPSYTKLAEELSISRRHAINAVKELLNKGLIESIIPSPTERGKKISNHYIFIWHECFINARPRRTGEQSFQVLVNNPSPVHKESDVTGEQSCTGGVNNSSPVTGEQSFQVLVNNPSPKDNTLRQKGERQPPQDS